MFRAERSVSGWFLNTQDPRVGVHLHLFGSCRDVTRVRCLRGGEGWEVSQGGSCEIPSPKGFQH